VKAFVLTHHLGLGSASEAANYFFTFAMGIRGSVYGRTEISIFDFLKSIKWVYTPKLTMNVQAKDI
jgi:hypothetical protein